MIEFPGDRIRGYPSTQSYGTQVKSVGGAEKYNMINADSITVRNIDASTASIKDLSVVTAKIADLAVLTAKIANLAVSEAKIADLAVTNAKINDLSAVKITAGTLSVGGTNQPTAILIGQSLLTGNARLAWVGGSRMWEDSSNRLGINSIGDMYIYTGSTQRIYIGADNVNIYPNSLYCHGIKFGFDGQTEGSIEDVDMIKGRNDIRFQIQGGNDFKFLDGDGHENAYIHGDTGRFQSACSYLTLNDVDKEAIIPTSKGYRALYCMESPEVWFMDFCKGRKIRKWPKFWQTDWILSLNNLFLEVTEQPYIIMPTTSKGFVQVWAKRKGMAYKRFEEKTKEEYDRNNEFWSQPMRGGENEKKKVIR